jgi:anti-sigma-K factor RskA
MSAHIANEVPRLLTGEASRDEVMTAAAHLRTCVDCQQELVSAVVAHASLTSAQRFAPEIVSGFPTDLFAERGGSDLTEVRLEVEDVDADVEHPEPELPASLPDLSAVFEQVRKEAAEPPRRVSAPRSRTRYLVAAAAAVVVLGGGATVYFSTSDNSSSRPATRSVKLAAFDQGTTAATASVSSSGKVHIDAAGLPQLSGKRYEVWLTNDGRTQMQPVGWISANGTAAMTVPPDLLSKYSDLEVSVQDVSAKDYAYSGTSVLRGYYD